MAQRSEDLSTLPMMDVELPRPSQLGLSDISVLSDCWGADILRLSSCFVFSRAETD